MALLGVSIGLRGSHTFILFSPDSHSGAGVLPHLWPLLSEGLWEPPWDAPQGLGITADQRCTGPWLESIPEASQGPGKKVQLVVPFPLEGGSGRCQDKRPQSPRLTLETLQLVSPCHMSTAATRVFQVQILEAGL